MSYECVVEFDLVQIHTLVVGQAASMGSLLLAAGTK